MVKSLNGQGVRDTILSQGKIATESATYFWGNIRDGVQDSTKGALITNSSRRAAILKRVKIFPEAMLYVVPCAVSQQDARQYQVYWFDVRSLVKSLLYQF